jgi:hypothetical protein
MLILRTRYPEYRAIALLEFGAIADVVVDPCMLWLAVANGQNAAANRTSRLRIRLQLEVIGLF